MENLNYSADLSELKEFFESYKKSSKQSQLKGDALLAKFFVPRKAKETFRILPPKPGKKRIEDAYFHIVTLWAAGGKKKHGQVLYCPRHNDPKVPKLDSNGKPILDSNGNPIMIPAPCPLCEKADKLLAMQDNSVRNVKKEDMTEQQKKIAEKNKEIFMEASKWIARKFYIVRGIDRGQEKDGVKFWRFKHNFKGQGVLDKLLPVLEDFSTTNKVDFCDPIKGTDLNIIVTEQEFNGRPYKQVTAITTKGSSLLHSDPIIMKQWLEDDIDWRDVFLPKRAPNITPYQYLELVASGNNPYWDDTDAKNKKWVFPNNPELEAAANRRKEVFDTVDSNITIKNVTSDNVGEYNDDAVDMANHIMVTDSIDNIDNESIGLDEDYKDLPF